MSTKDQLNTMLTIKLRTNRQTSKPTFYFLHILVFLQICTASFHMVHGLNNNDNEAIIQLSIDSIHVVKSSDTRFNDIEENANDDDEKKLLIALLTSFDDDNKNIKESQSENQSRTKGLDEILTSNNCTSTVTMSTTASASSSSLNSIRFVPSVLDFGEQSIAIPRMQTVTIVNDYPEPVELQSLSGTTVQFYSSFFTQKLLLSNGGNTTINVYYLPRTLGITKSTFTIKTNHGIMQYYVSGIGVPNPFHIRPLLGATVPLNSTFEYVIHFYNPYNYSIDINEIYTSDENLIIELLSYKIYKTKVKKMFEHKEQWHLLPYEMKPIIKINYFAYKIDHLHGFYCIKTNSNDTIIVPVEINVLNSINLYSNVDILEFSPDGLIRSTARPITIPVYVINNGVHPVTVTEVRISTANINYASIHYEDLEIPAGIHHLTKIAELTIDPHLIPNDIQRIRGSVHVFTSSNINKPALSIPFRASILHGSLDYEKETTFFYISSNSADSPYETNQECQSIKLINQFNASLVVYNVTTDKFDLLSKYIKIKTVSSFIYINPGQTISVACASTVKQPIPSTPFYRLEASLTLHTNLSFFHLPIYLYSGLLNVNLVTGSTNGGIKRNDTNPLQFFIASIPVNTYRSVRFILVNMNPIDIFITKISMTLPKATIQLIHIELLNGTETKTPVRSSYQNDNIVDLVLPANRQAIFSLTINGTNDPSLYNETITFETRYQKLMINVKYSIINGFIKLVNKNSIHIDVFPNRIGMAPIYLHNGFNEPTDIARMEFPSYGKSFSFIWNNTSPGRLIIRANETYRIGELCFDMIPLCNSIQLPSESTCYCGLNNHPKFKQRWEHHVSALNAYELDHILVTKFRNLWKEWTSLVRKQKIHTNIWLVTDQANVSWPVTIGFVWPSVLEHMSSAMSRTPVLLDFHLVHVNTTKTQNVIVTNPSSSTIQYSVELIEGYEERKPILKNAAHSHYSTFTIEPTSKQVEISNNIYKFSLRPNEYMIFAITYKPMTTIKNEMYLVIRNNLTIIESVHLHGEGGSGILTVGNRKAGSSDVPLLLEMHEKQFELCSSYAASNGIRRNLLLQKVITIRNTGNMKAVIHDISFGNSKCSGQGFAVDSCMDIEIEPHGRQDIIISFQPDYTLAEIVDSLNLNTNIGILTFPIVVRIPQRVLAICYSILPRPFWESQIRWLCLLFMVMMILFIIGAALYDARRLFYDYLARAELRDRLSETDSLSIAPRDLASAVQQEQSSRDRNDLRGSVSINPKKEAIKDESKAKENEIKPKRLNTPANGNKDSADISSKPLRNSSGSQTSTRSSAASPKALTQKDRRAAMENVPSKSIKNQTEHSLKPQPVRTQKSSNQESPSNISSCSQTSQSPEQTDDETAPFFPARVKRAPGKTKDSSSLIGPAKSVSNVDTNAPSQLIKQSSPTVLQCTSTTTNSKSSPRPDHTDQQDLSESTESINDQSWHMVSPNRGHRKGSTTLPNRRETMDESQTINKTNKHIANNAENSLVLPSFSSSRSHASVSSQAALTRRRRGRRPACLISPVPDIILTKRKSLQTNTPISIRNRELAFRQLAEQLWAAGLPSSTTACSMSIRSRCSSAPPSERGGCDNDLTAFSRVEFHNDEDENIDWDEPDKPDQDFDRYASQTKQFIEERRDINDFTQQEHQQQPIISTIRPVNVSPSIVIPASKINDEIEPLPFVQHGPGPIQRPSKLGNSTARRPPSTSFLLNPIQSPGTPDVLDQINRLLDHQDSQLVNPGTATPNLNSSSVPMNDLITPNIPWTPFSPTEWPSKYNSSWSLTNIENSPVPLTTQVQNPFAVMSVMNEPQQQPHRVEASVWTPMLGTTLPRVPLSSTRSEPTSSWNTYFASTIPSSIGLNNSTNDSWLKFPSGSDSSSGTDSSSNGEFWNLTDLSNEQVPVSPPTLNHEQPVSQIWWSDLSSDENNNRNQPNNLNTDTQSNAGKSRWNFAR